MAALNWVAVAVGLVLALHHVVAAATVYLILFYATFVGGSARGILRVRPLHLAGRRKVRQVRRHRRDAGRDPRRARRPSPGCRTREQVEFRSVSFSYRPDATLFDRLSLRIDPGEHVGLVGASGSGKSTLTKLVLRFMDVDSGTILVDGQDISTVTQHSLRRSISYVPQDPQMLHRTIAENISYGSGSLDRPDLDLVREVGRAAHVEEFVAELPDGYDTVVGERGLKLSGGQRQRRRDRTGDGEERPGADPRRGDLGARLRVGDARPGRAVEADGAIDGPRRRPPPGDRGAASTGSS